MLHGAGLGAFLVLAAGCGAPPEPPAPALRPLPISEGEHLAGLSDAEVGAFLAGRGEFTLLRNEDGGLGPLFNARSCVECHGIPQVGGSGNALVTRAGFALEDGGFEPLPGGTLIPSFSIKPGVVQAHVPDGAVVARRRINMLFGAGLIEAIPDQTLEALASGPKPTGVRGRVHWGVDPLTGARRAGRFGWKAIEPTVEAFAAKALRDELGVTNPLFPDEVVSGADPAAVASIDPWPEPEATEGVTASLAAYVRGLAPLPPPGAGPDGGVPAGRAGLAPGARAFIACGCNACHVPELLTGDSETVAFDRVRVPLYSDLLLHEVGQADGIGEGDAAPTEMRTPPLWGLWARGTYWHDGRARSVREAIELHALEAAESRAAFEGLGAADQDELIAFLRTL